MPGSSIPFTSAGGAETSTFTVEPRAFVPPAARIQSVAPSASGVSEGIESVAVAPLAAATLMPPPRGP